MHADWHLRTDPFPFVGTSLSPQNDPGQLAYYLDLYDWSEAEIFAGLRQDGSIRILSVPELSPTTILISGEVGAGRSSMKNLLLFELQKGKDPAPVVLDVPVPPSPSRQQVANLLSIKVMAAVRARQPALAADVQQTIATWQLIAGSDPNAESLFPLLADHLRDAAPGAEIIVVLDASNHNLTRDAARATSEMLRGFATYVIMSLTAADDARRIKNSLAGASRAWIAAPYVEAAKVKDYVERRLTSERMPGFNPASATFPFEPGAIDELFRSTAGGGTGTVSISIVLKRLTAALRQKAAQAGPPVTITKADMQAILGR